ncbi:MAG: hypothetical protein RL653_3857 [Pseudomonadota bacterium]|jgi:hypothetical protein
MEKDLPAVELHALEPRQLERALSWCTPERALSELARLQARHTRPRPVLLPAREPGAWRHLRRRLRKLPS